MLLRLRKGKMDKLCLGYGSIGWGLHDVFRITKRVGNASFVNGRYDDSVNHVRRHNVPITQDRMLKLISAGTNYQRAFTTLAAMTHGYAERAENAPDKASLLAMFRELALMTVPANILREPEASSATLAEERAHFKAVKNYNNRSRERMAAKRSTPPAGPALDDNPRTIDPYASGAFTAQAALDAPGLAPREREANAEVRASIARAAQALASGDAAAPVAPKNTNKTGES